MRKATVKRETKETRITLSLDLDEELAPEAGLHGVIVILGGNQVGVVVVH